MVMTIKVYKQHFSRIMYKYFPGLQLKVIQFTLSLHVVLSLVGGFYNYYMYCACKLPS